MEGSGDGMKTNPFETTPFTEKPSVFETKCRAVVNSVL